MRLTTRRSRRAAADATQAALLAYVRCLAQQLDGVQAAAVEVGPLADQLLPGLGALPLAPRALQLVLPSAASAAHLLAGVAADMIQQPPGPEPADTKPGAGEAAAAAAPAGPADAPAAPPEDAGAPHAARAFRYLSRGLLATPPATLLDSVGAGTSWLHALLEPARAAGAAALVAAAALAGGLRVAETAPPGAVADEALGWRLHALVDALAGQLQAETA